MRTTIATVLIAASCCTHGLFAVYDERILKTRQEYEKAAQAKYAQLKNTRPLRKVQPIVKSRNLLFFK